MQATAFGPTKVTQQDPAMTKSIMHQTGLDSKWMAMALKGTESAESC